MSSVTKVRRSGVAGPSTRSWRSSVNRGVSREQRLGLLLAVTTVFFAGARLGVPGADADHVADDPAAGRQPAAGPARAPVVRGRRAGAASRRRSRCRTRSPTGSRRRRSCRSLIGLIVLVTSFRRTRLGVAGLRGESMFVDLRDRILTQGTIPPLPHEWDVESALRSAGWHAVRRRLRGRRQVGRRTPPRARGRRRVRQGRAGRHPGAAAVRGVRRPARRAAAGALPARGQRLPAAPGVGRGLRHRGPPLARPRHRRLRGPHGRSPAGGPPRWPAPAAGRCCAARGRCSA